MNILSLLSPLLSYLLLDHANECGNVLVIQALELPHFIRPGRQKKIIVVSLQTSFFDCDIFVMIAALERNSKSRMRIQLILK